MIRIGYVRFRDARRGADQADQAVALKALDCQVVRCEAPLALGGADLSVLNSILDFMADGDELVVLRLEQLAASGRGLLQVLERLEARGASLRVVEPELCSHGPGGQALRAAIEAVAAIEPASARPRRPAASQEIRALQSAGVGPVEIARRLGISRMTVWRKLKAMEACN
jgi:DNA invertase Pin-like site-specific DNA recombinase